MHTDHATSTLQCFRGAKGESSDHFTHRVYLNLPSAWLLESKIGPEVLSNHRAGDVKKKDHLTANLRNGE
ncbi:hypothetical protein MUK42_31704 [Musa troglodytarum]|uniref:Uncharacterized protein n=1 Tax=Musa troglodytarum TaxID=320322 RepID=A0A9E7EMS3_9LILI|nr:hypothetical protein MUK42_31704 [Musa troglodytarum]